MANAVLAQCPTAALTGKGVCPLASDGAAAQDAPLWGDPGSWPSDPAAQEASVSRARTLHGKAMSYNNFLDANSALELVTHTDPSRSA